MKTLGKIVTLLGAALFSTSLFAQELPKVRPEQMHWIMFGQHAGSQICITLGYDTDGDGYEDTRFHYMTSPVSGSTRYTQLTGYAVDRNRDLNFSDDEWTIYIQRKENGGIDLQEPENSREISY